MTQSITRSLVSAGLAVAGLALCAPAAFADGCNLYTANSSCPTNSNTGTFGSALFYHIDPQPTGTGYIDSFLRLQMKGQEQGYNTDGTLQFDEKTDDTFTHAIQLGDISVVNIGGTNYLQFFLDINEEASNTGTKLTLDQLEIYTGTTGDASGYTGTANSGASGALSGTTKRYDMDSGADNWINLDYSLNKGGSGMGDMVVYIPYANFAGLSSSTYVYLFSQFGCSPENTQGQSGNGTGECGTGNQKKYISGAGFEEWWVMTPGSSNTSPVPEPASLLLLGTGGTVLLRRRFARAR